MDPADLLCQARAANGSDAMSQEALVALLKAALKVAEEAVPAPGSKPGSEPASGPVSESGSESDSESLSDTPPYNPFTTRPGANYGKQEDFFLAVAPRNAVKNANRNCALFSPDDLEKTRIGIDIFPESPVQLALVKGCRSNCKAFIGLRITFPRSSDTSYAMWYDSPQGALLPTSKHSLLLKFPSEGLEWKHRSITDEEYAQLKDCLVKHNVSSDFRVITISINDGTTLIPTGYGLPFAGKTREIES